MEAGFDMTSTTKTYLLAILFAAVLSASYLLDGPSEIQAITDVQAEVIAVTGGE